LSYRVAGPVAVLLLLCCGAAGADEPASDVRVLLTPRVEATLSSALAGRIQELLVREGDRVAKGAALLRFDCALQRAELAKASAQLKGAGATFQSNQKLSSLGSSSQLDLVVSEAKMEEAKAEVARIRAEIDRCEISAPFDGRVAEIKAHAYESVAQGQPLLALLADRDLEAKLFVPSQWLRWLKTGQPFRMQIGETGREYAAHIDAIGARVDPVSQSIPLRGRIEGDHPELLAGMSGVALFDPPKAAD